MIAGSKRRKEKELRETDKNNCVREEEKSDK
jgi:hypothetical protein